tara:strand:+ start:61 stop:978 length:918 start_codon:yes stop_codon:yes gene_type:complete
MAATNTPVMNVSGAGSDYIFVYEGNDTTTYADLSALGNSIIGWSATCTSGSCTVGDVLYVSGVGGNGNDYLFLYTEDASGNTDYPVSGAWYSFTAPAAPTPVYGSTALTTAQQSRVDAALAAYNSGAGDTVEANIFGDENLVNIIQAGGVSYLNLAIAGNLNTFDSEQDLATGSHGYIEATIIGNSNDVDILQKGNNTDGTGDKAAIVTITGNSNTVDIRQHGLGDKFLDLEITGNDHSASIFQNGAGNHSARVALDGSQPWNFDLTQNGATSQTYTLPHTMSDGAAVSGTCSAIGGCNLTILQQ